MKLVSTGPLAPFSAADQAAVWWAPWDMVGDGFNNATGNTTVPELNKYMCVLMAVCAY